MRNEPLVLDSRVELTGDWWRPQSPEHHAAGRLTFEPGERMVLELTSGADLLMDERRGDSDEFVSWLHGLTVEGRPVTLRGCQVTRWSLNAPGGLRQEAVVDLAVWGAKTPFRA